MFNLSKLCTKAIPASIRFERSYIPVTESGCWLWIGATNFGGYGRLSVNHKMVMAHRFAYEKYLGVIPDRLTLDHSCKVTACVNPSHLEPVTMKENILRGDGFCARNARKTHCKAGHMLTQTYDQRGCLTCNNARQSQYRKQRKQLKEQHHAEV